MCDVLFTIYCLLFYYLGFTISWYIYIYIYLFIYLFTIYVYDLYFTIYRIVYMILESKPYPSICIGDIYLYIESNSAYI